MITQDTFLIKLDLSFADYWRATCWMTVRMKIIRRFFLLSIALGVLGLLSNTLLAPGEIQPWYVLVFVFLMPVMFFGAFFLVAITVFGFFIYRSRVRYLKGASYRFTHWGIEKSGKGIESSTPWHQVTKVRESKSFLFLYISENDAHIVQKSQFSSQQEWSEFMAMIKEKTFRL
jgi:hypothetical protein